jgi:hypothetical protein
MNQHYSAKTLIGNEVGGWRGGRERQYCRVVRDA